MRIDSSDARRWSRARRLGALGAACTAAAFALLLAVPKRAERERETYLVSVSARDQVEWLAREGFDLAAVHLPPPAGSGEGSVEVIANRAEAKRIAAKGLSIRRIERRAAPGRPSAAPSSAKSAASTLPPGFGGGKLGGYYDLAEIEALLDHYAATYPAIVAPKIVIGTSVEGRPIHALKVSDAPGVSENEPRILIDALHHAREPASMQTAFLLLHRLVADYGVDPEITGLVNGREIFFIACVNPDGYAHNAAIAPAGGGLWRKNRAVLPGGCVGVDLNRNYAFQFGIDDVGSSPNPCAESYRGPAPLSEPESRAVEAFAAQLGVRVAVSLHAHGRQMIHPFGHALLAPSDLAVYEAHGEMLAASNGYVFGAVSDTVGFANGNYVDHMHSVIGAEAWAFEIGTSFWPSMSELLEVAESNLAPLRRLIAVAGSDLEVIGVTAVDVGGDLDGHPEPGELVEPRIVLRNLGRMAAAPFSLSIAPVDPSIAAPGAGAAGPVLAPLGQTTIGKNALRLALPTTLAPGTRVELLVTIAFDGRTVTRAASFDVGARRVLAEDDAESDLGWALGIPGDDATTGRWTRGDPIGVTHGLEVATPEDDASPGSGARCFVTGIGSSVPGQDDVDDGATTLESPLFDLSECVSPRLVLSRFYWCSKADSPLSFSISNDGGATYHPLGDLTGRPNSWRTSEWIVSDLVAPTDRMKLRVVASDEQNTSVVEAAIDELAIIDFGTRPHATVWGRPRLGKTVQLSIAGARELPVALLAASGSANLAVVGLVGALRLDPASLEWLGIVGPSAVEPLSYAFALPANPALAGIEIFLQPIGLGSPAIAGNLARVVLEAP